MKRAAAFALAALFASATPPRAADGEDPYAKLVPARGPRPTSTRRRSNMIERQTKDPPVPGFPQFLHEDR